LYAIRRRLARREGQARGDIRPGQVLFGTLGQSASQLAKALSTQTLQEKTLARLFAYANLSADQDTRVSSYQGMSDEMTQLAAEFGAAWGLCRARAAHARQEHAGVVGGLDTRARSRTGCLSDVLRRKAHTLSAHEEALLAQTLPLTSAAANISSIFLNADLPWPTIKQASGAEVRLDVAGFAAARGVADRDDRRKAMEAFFGALGSYRRTIGSTLSTAVQGALFQTHARKYESTLQAALDGPNIPPSVYTALVDGVNANLPAFHRYLKLRQRILGLSELHYYDLYAPLVAGVPLDYTVEQAQDEVKRTTRSWARTTCRASTGPSRSAGSTTTRHRQAVRRVHGRLLRTMSIPTCC
jgi:oligoendopeptidase F